MNLTDKQLIHRAYLASPLWASKRTEALNFYGTICGRCGEYGNDVHHKTYARVGGAELMEDLEVVCRDCHEAHHRCERATRQVRSPRRRSVNVKALFGYLTEKQRLGLMQSFGLSRSGLYADLTAGVNQALTAEAVRLLGVDGCHGFVKLRVPQPKGISKLILEADELTAKLVAMGMPPLSVKGARVAKLRAMYRKQLAKVPPR